MRSLFRLGVVPVVNENDAISLNDRVYRGTGKRPIFDDNDRLGALVASELAADLIVLLTDVPGVMAADPRRDAAARLIPRIDRPEDHAITVEGRSEAGRGMASKLEAASVASRGGCHTVIASGLDPGALDRVLAGEEEGTWIPPRATLSSRSRWIAYCSHPRGTLVLRPEAADRLREGATLRAGGAAKAEGLFRRGDVVEIRAPDGSLVGRSAPFGGLELVHGEHIILKDRSDG
ncbi:PUA domain-containing protein [Candidatus Palauibacter sp.]|uniref:amino acid kinase family protein n=1 Tax=Candidatus Palauibacter sp. TaxID=3101350 RepID=UPI003B52CF1F